LKWLIKTYETTTNKAVLQSFYKLAGTQKLQQQIEDGKSEADIRRAGKPV
jgi:hypothetical protein